MFFRLIFWVSTERAIETGSGLTEIDRVMAMSLVFQMGSGWEPGCDINALPATRANASENANAPVAREARIPINASSWQPFSRSNLARP